jgi:hypothetical protein
MCDASISARFLIYGTHTVCFLPLVTILDSCSQRISWGAYHINQVEMISLVYLYVYCIPI